MHGSREEREGSGKRREELGSREERHDHAKHAKGSCWFCMLFLGSRFSTDKNFFAIFAVSFATFA
jgi:hypothetical protein